MALNISDSLGNPILFSNGHDVYHQNGEIMENGKNLVPVSYPWLYPFGSMYPYQILCLPDTRKKGSYYLAYADSKANALTFKELNLSKIEGAVDSFSGKVVYRNKVILQHRLMGVLNACKHANGRDWWVVVPEYDSTVQETVRDLVFLLADDTMKLVHSVPHEPIAEPANSPYDWYGTTTFSPDGNFFLMYNSGNGLNIRRFDRCSGEFFNRQYIAWHGNWPNIAEGNIAVSRNSRFAYVMASDFILQFDLWADDIAASRDTVAIYDGHASPNYFSGVPIETNAFCNCAFAPDGKVYLMCNSSLEIGYVSKPHKKGKACEVRQHSLLTPAGLWGIPYYPHYRLGPLDGSACDTLGMDNHPVPDFSWFADSTLSVEFADNSTYEPSTWHWDFAGLGTSQDTNPVFVFPAAGVYQVCLTVCNPYSCDTVCKMVTVGVSAGHETAPPEKTLAAQVFPNPADDVFQLLYETPSAGALFELFDATGRLLRARTLSGKSGNVIFNVEALPRGLYCWRVRGSEGGFGQTGKLLLHRK